MSRKAPPESSAPQEENRWSNRQRKLTGCRLIKLVSGESINTAVDGDTFFIPKPRQYFNERVLVSEENEKSPKAEIRHEKSSQFSFLLLRSSSSSFSPLKCK
jgi:hypothetical protein